MSERVKKNYANTLKVLYRDRRIAYVRSDDNPKKEVYTSMAKKKAKKKAAKKKPAKKKKAAKKKPAKKKKAAKKKAKKK